MIGPGVTAAACVCGPPVLDVRGLSGNLLGVMVQAHVVGGTVSGKCRLMSNTEQRQPVSL